MNVLITGAAGFVGSHLAEYIYLNHKDAFKIYGLVRRRTDLSNLSYLKGKIELLQGDITDSVSIDNLFKQTKFSLCFHLAGQSHVPTSWKNPLETTRVNVEGTINLLEAIRHHNRGCQVLICGSSEEYGLVHKDEIPISELNPLRPMSPYAASKVAEDFLGMVYHHSYGLRVIRTRAFNHTGPRRPEDFILGKITKQAVEIKLGHREGFSLGNLDAVRDITDVRDMVRAYWMALEKGKEGEVYNICTGVGIKIVELLRQTSALWDVPPDFQQDPLMSRPADVQILIGNCNKFTKATGWLPFFLLDQTIGDMCRYWDGKLKHLAHLST